MINNLMFDLGGVIMDIKKDNCVQALKELGFPNPGDFLGEFAQKGPFGLLESGKITPSEFRDFIRSYVGAPLTDRQINTALNAFLVGIPVERLRQLKQLRRKYRIYLLSNTNVIMWYGKIEQEFSKDGLSIEAYFDGILTSFEAKMMKPDRGIFRYAEMAFGICPEETLFLDDSMANIEAAESMGFHGAHVPIGHEFYKVLCDLNLCR